MGRKQYHLVGNPESGDAVGILYSGKSPLYRVEGYAYDSCVCEPATWVVCCGFILAALYLFRNDFRDDNIKETV